MPPVVRTAAMAPAMQLAGRKIPGRVCDWSCWHRRSKPGVGEIHDASLPGFGRAGRFKVLSANYQRHSASFSLSRNRTVVCETACFSNTPYCYHAFTRRYYDPYATGRRLDGCHCGITIVPLEGTEIQCPLLWCYALRLVSLLELGLLSEFWLATTGRLGVTAA